MSLIDLCAVAESCIRLQNVADEVSKCEIKNFEIPQSGVSFGDHKRILKCFGHLIQSITCITKFGGAGMNKKKTNFAFNWLEKYCANTVEKLTIIGSEEIVLPSSAINLMSKVKTLTLFSQIPDDNLRAALWNCKDLIELNLQFYDGPFNFADHHFPHLQKLDHRVRVDHNFDFRHIESFFKNHTKIVVLGTQFLIDERQDTTIDLSYIKHLVDLKRLDLILVAARIVGIDALAHLKKLKYLSIDSSKDMQTDTAILDSLASVDSLVKLELGIPEFDHLISSIGRFKNLSELAISEDILAPATKFDTNISCLRQLRNSHLTELRISCMQLLEPKTIVDVIRNLTEIKKIKFICDVELTESICKNLAYVCASQKRKLEIILEEEIMDEMDFDFSFIDKFNKEFGAFVEINT